MTRAVIYARLWTPLAEQGNANAQFGLGFIYVNGHGVPKIMLRQRGGTGWRPSREIQRRNST